MRPILALTVLLLSLNSAAPETPESEYSSLVAGSRSLTRDAAASSLIEIESSIAKGDRGAVATLRSDDPTDQSPSAAVASPSALAPVQVNPADIQTPATADGEREPVSLADLCNALFTSAEDNDLPVPFFANLIWQESRFRDDAVSSKGALGIAQFMPEVAAEEGLADPFDALQSLSASARLLRELRLQFGNLGLVAAAYNAGPHRVTEWLQRGRTLPRETRGYVISVTGRSVDEWRKTPPVDVALHFEHRLPCRDLPAFAEFEETQRLTLAQLERAQLAQAQAQQRQLRQQIVTDGHQKRQHIAMRRHLFGHRRREPVIAESSHHRGRHEAEPHSRHASHERRRSA